MKNSQLLLLPVMFLVFYSCGSDNDEMKEMEMEMQMETLVSPELNTKPFSNLSSNSVTSGGIITELGTPEVNRVGIVYSELPNPSIADQSVMEDFVNSDFEITIEGLEENTTYYAKAFASNDNTTSYGNEISFMTNSTNVVVEPNCSPDKNMADINGTRQYTNVNDNDSAAPYTITANGSQGDMTFHFSKKPESGVYITSSDISFLQDGRCNVSAVFSNFFWNTHTGDTLYVDRPSDNIISMTFCDFTFTTSQLSFDVENAFGNVTLEE